MSATFIPSLTSVIICGWVAVPAVFPQAFPALVIGTIFLAWTKYTETIVADRGNMPSVHQCYYKAFLGRFLRPSRLSVGEKVPRISSEAADVLFSLKLQYDFDNLVAPWAATEDVAPEPAAPTNGAPAPPPLTDEMRSVIAVTSTFDRTLSPAFLMIPAFNMDLSIMAFSAFPLKAYEATLIRADVTLLRPAHRRAALSFSSHVEHQVERDGDVELDFVTLVSLDADASPPAPGTPEAAAAATGAAPAAAPGGGKRSQVPLARRNMVPLARIVHTYRFPGSAASAAAAAAAGAAASAPSAAPRVRVPAPAPTALPDVPAATLTVSPADTVSFVNASGNAHPRHLPPWVGTLLADSTAVGSVVDPMHAAAALLAAAVGRAPSAPLRFVVEVEQLAQAPVEWSFRVAAPVNAPAPGAEGALPEPTDAADAAPFEGIRFEEQRALVAEADGALCLVATLLTGGVAAAGASAEKEKNEEEEKQEAPAASSSSIDEAD